jgi:glucosamine-6-phosphate deaminase
MNVVVVDSVSTGARLAADIVQHAIVEKPSLTLGLATGGTVESVYGELISRHLNGLSFSRVTGFLLDEYMDLEPSHPQTYDGVIRRIFVDHINMRTDAIRGPNGSASNLAVEALEYDVSVRAARVDVQLLGIGRNGHIAFNEQGGGIAGISYACCPSL